MAFDLDAWAGDRRARVDAWLRPLFDDVWPAAFAEPLAYPVFGGGKRVRPLLCLAAAEALGQPPEIALAPAAAVELVHTYSLVHDDLPAMDDDDERRGRPTVHVAFDEATAILVGDALLTEAFRVLAEAQADPAVQVRWISELARASGHHGMVGGQVADVAWSGDDSAVSAVEAIHRAKTGALLRAAVVLGGLAAGASEAQLEAMVRYGEQLGLAFQLADDVLDADEDSGDDGPPSYVSLLGLEATGARARACADAAIEAIADLPSPEALIALANFTVERRV